MEIKKLMTKKLMTKKEIADIWLEGGDKTSISPCCPNCRDNLLERTDNKELFCANSMCRNMELYSNICNEENEYEVIGNIKGSLEAEIHGKED